MPDIGDLAKHVRFSPDAGRIWVREQRGVLMSSMVFGSFRREITERQGIASAREMYSRIGYAEGTRDAAAARELRPDVSFFEAFAVGPQTYALYGFGWTEVLSLEVEPDSGTFFGDFFVNDSIEANEHLANFGPSAEPVCWMACGYASGFISAFVGRPCLVREIECRGMGCTSCRLVGRPLEEWDNASEETRFYRPGPEINRFGRKVDAESILSPDVIGISAGFATTLHLVTKAAPSKATLLFMGETGVGKEVFARLAHRMSPRHHKPFVAVNCGALPETLIESELFGVVRGAFTGADASRPGRFERAQGGTLFLDEVSTLSHTAQVKLLRTLQEREIERVGDVKTRRIDVRVIAASNIDLREAVDNGDFREDLYYRLATFPIRIPPLRERRDDIPLLMEHFRARYCAEHGRRVPGFTARAVEALLSYKLPGNIRELEHRIERAVLLANDDEPLDLPHLFQGDEGSIAAMFNLDHAGHLRAGDTATLRRCATELLGAITGQEDGYESIERELLEAAVADSGGNISAAARTLGLTRRQVAVRLDRLRTKIAAEGKREKRPG